MKTVFVAHRDIDTLVAIQDELETRGYLVEAVPTAEQLLDCLYYGIPDFVIISHDIGWLSGVHAAQTLIALLVSHNRWENCQIIVITNKRINWRHENFRISQLSEPLSLDGLHYLLEEYSI